MTEANLSDVKNELSRYVQRVRRGERVRILIHGVPVAELVPIEHRDDDEELRSMEQRGVVRRGRGGLARELLKPGPRVSDGAVEHALAEERAER